MFQNYQQNSIKGINFLNQKQNFVNIANKEIKADFLLKPVIEYFFLLDELNKIINPNKTKDIQSLMEIIKSKAGPKLKTAKNYKQVFDLILTGLDPKVQGNKEYYNQSEQYDEEKGLKRFMERHNAEKIGNIILKLFLIPREQVIYCKKCKMNSYQFGYGKYISMDNPQIGLISQKLFTPKKKETKGKSCNFCNGETTECIIVKKMLELPEKLIVIIGSNQINNFVL